MSLTLPTLITNPWRYGSLSSAGNINSIPNTSTGSFLASFQDGFPQITMTPEGAGGTPSPGGDTNGIFNIITSFQLWVNAGGHFPYNAALAAAIGGYPLNAILTLTSSNSTVISTIAGNLNNPNTNMTGWAPHGGALMATLAQVNTAQSTANSAVASAASAQSAANSALSAAVTAEANALTGISNAAAAQTAANTAEANAVNAQNTANSAQINASIANSKAKGWSTGSYEFINLSTTGQMVGLSAGRSIISTQSTGNLLVFVTGAIYIDANPSTVEILTLIGKWGTGPGPSAGSGAIGNSFSTPAFQVESQNPQMNLDGLPFTFVGYIASGTGNIWVDLEAYGSSLDGTVQLQNCNMVVIEIA